MKHAWHLSVLLASAVAISACGESTSGNKSTKKADGKAWEGAGPTYAASGWKPGDKASWDEQMRVRVQLQNDYSRAK